MNFLFCFLVTCFGVLFAGLDDDVSVFNLAVEESKAGNFSKAIELYRQIPESFNVCINIASCYYCLNDHISSFLFLRKAEKYAGPIQRIRLLTLLDSARSNLGLKRNEYVGYWAALKRQLERVKFVVLGISTPFLEVIVLVFWLLFLISLKRKLHVAIRTLGFLILSLALLLLLTVDCYRKTSQAIVVNPNASLFSGPGEDFVQIGSLRPGVEVAVREKVGGFSRIEVGAKQGWIHNKDIVQV